MKTSRSWKRARAPRFVVTATATAFLLALPGRGVLAQARDNVSGFAVHELGMSVGYALEQLPPITLGGELPSDVLDADLITSATAAIDWHHVTPRASYALDLSGTYTSRAVYSQLNAPGGDLTFSMSHALGRRWRLNAALSGSLTSADQMAYQQTQVGRLVGAATSFDDLAGTVALARSPSPDLSQAVLFVPISQSLAASDLYGNRVMAGAARVDANYVASARLAVNVHASDTAARRVSASSATGLAIPFPDSIATDAGIAVSYGRSERSQVTAALDYTKASGSYTDEAMVASGGYGWSGRKWFAATTLGTAIRPFHIPAFGPVTTIRNLSPAIVGTGKLGYKFRTQTLLVEYRRATHDEFGHGGRDIATGFEGNVQSAAASWAWMSPRSRWIAQSNFSVLRGPGNFSYIFAWLSTLSAGRELSSGVRLTGEVLFDRHGSRGFEGFHLMREGARLNVTWIPQRRPAA